MMRGSSRRGYPRISTFCYSTFHPLHIQSQARFSSRNIHSISDSHSPISIQSNRRSAAKSKSRLSSQRSTLLLISSNFHSFNLQQRNLPISSFDVHTPRSKPKTDPHWLKRQELSRRKVENKKHSQDLKESNAARNLDPILFQVRKALDNKDLLRATELARQLQEEKSGDTRRQDPTSHPNLISNLTSNEYLKAFDQFNLIFNKFESGSNSVPLDLKARFEFWEDNLFQFIKDGTNPSFNTQVSKEESLVLLVWARIKSIHRDKLVEKDRETKNDRQVANVIASWFSEVEIVKQVSVFLCLWACNGEGILEIQPSHDLLEAKKRKRERYWRWKPRCSRVDILNYLALNLISLSYSSSDVGLPTFSSYFFVRLRTQTSQSLNYRFQTPVLEERSTF